MPNNLQTPGVYIHEVTAFASPIMPSPTAITLILGEFSDGRTWPVENPPLWSVTDFEVAYGPALDGDPLCQAVRRFFAEGGLQAQLARYLGTDGLDAAGLDARIDPASPFNLIITAPPAPIDSWEALLTFARDRSAFLILDGPLDGGVLEMPALDETLLRHGALYSPWLMPDHNSQAPAEPPSAAVAGVYARTDANRGVWKPPAGTMATIDAGVMRKLDDNDQAAMAQAGQNAIRDMSLYGTVIWGARTMGGADGLASDYRYVPVMRLAQYILRSISQGLSYAAFEPNNAALWSGITRLCTTFLTSQWADGAFVGNNADDALFVRCDATTTTPVDIANGVANVQIGFAPVHPAEFVVLTISVKTAAA
jgi:phage tail sheath protein FI